MLQAADRITLALIFLNASAFVLATTGVGAPELLKMPLLAGLHYSWRLYSLQLALQLHLLERGNQSFRTSMNVTD
jgi:hypothetical protein